jgi:hypothetical protein
VAQERRPGITDQIRRRARRLVEPADQWRTKVQGWVDAGIVSSAQGDQILATEVAESDFRTGAARADTTRPSLSSTVEVVSYVGIVVVGLSSVLFLGPYWIGVGIAGHLSVAIMVMVAGLSGGFVVAQIGDAGSRRLGGFLRLIGTAGAAMTTAVAVGPSAASHRGLALLYVGVAVLALSAVLWRNLDRPLQFLSTLIGLALTLSSLGTVARLHPTSTEVSLLVWFLAMAVGLMSLQMLRPAPTALVVAELGSFVGAFALSFPNHLGGVLLGLTSTLIAVAIGFILERPPIVVLGALGFFMFDFRVFSIYLRSTSAALGAFVLGLVLVFVALWRASTAERREPTPQIEVHANAEWFEPW